MSSGIKNMSTTNDNLDSSIVDVLNEETTTEIVENGEKSTNNDNGDHHSEKNPIVKFDLGSMDPPSSTSMLSPDVENPPTQTFRTSPEGAFIKPQPMR